MNSGPYDVGERGGRKIRLIKITLVFLVVVAVAVGIIAVVANKNSDVLSTNNPIGSNPTSGTPTNTPTPTPTPVGKKRVLSKPKAKSWPGESIANAIDLTSIEGPEPNDFYDDLSGCFWNPVTNSLWLTGNGRFWVAVEDGLGGFEIGYKNNRRGEWTGLGDTEDITQVSLTEDAIYLIMEGDERIQKYDTSVYGRLTLLLEWDTSPYLPLNAELGLGSEGLTFVPDSYLFESDFVDGSGNKYTSKNGMGGLFFIGHQNGGFIFVFDLSPSSSYFSFVGKYITDYDEIASLFYDTSTNRLYVYNDNDGDIMSVLDLSSVAVPGFSHRQFVTVEAFKGPSNQNNEGFAMAPATECVDGKRNFFMTIDDGQAASLKWYRGFTHGCS